jgi:hypothetical protein
MLRAIVMKMAPKHRRYGFYVLRCWGQPGFVILGGVRRERSADAQVQLPFLYTRTHPLGEVTFAAVILARTL